MILDRLGSDFDVSADEIAVLTTLRFGGGVSQKQIAELTNLRRSTLSMMLGRLEKAGLASRKTNPKDARSRIFSITAEGDQILNKLVIGIFNIEGAYAERIATPPGQAIQTMFELRKNILQAGLSELEKIGK